MVHPPKIATIVNSIKNISNGGIVIKTVDNEMSHLFYKNLLVETKEKYTVRDVQLRKPRIRIRCREKILYGKSTH